MATLVVLGASALIKFGAMYFLKKQKPKNLECVGTVCELKIFPVKSMGGIDLLEGNCSKRGIESRGFDDRRWIVLDPDNHMVTMKMDPRMSLLATKLIENGVEICVPSSPDINPLKLFHDIHGKNSMMISVYNEDILVYESGEEANEWIDSFFGKKPGYKIVYFPLVAGDRPVHTNKARMPWVARTCDATDKVGLANFAPYLMTTKSSLQDLNKRLSVPVQEEVFRSNIILDGTIPWDEDNWEYIYINNVCFRKIKDCTRCPMITVDVAKGEFREDGEPTKTLQTFRVKPDEYGEKTMFGINLLVKQPGIIRVGDKVEILRVNK